LDGGEKPPNNEAGLASRHHRRRNHCPSLDPGAREQFLWGSQNKKTTTIEEERGKVQ